MPRASSRSSASDSASCVLALETSSCGRRVVADAALEEAQLEREGDEALLGAVVEVALQAPALGVARRDDALARGLHLGQPRPGLRVQALVLERHGRGGPARPR